LKQVKTLSTLLVLTFLLLAACKPAQKVQQRGGYLLVKNTIKNKNNYLPVDELEGFIQQNSMPGRLAPYFRPGVYFYERSLKGKETKYRLFLRKSLGKKPVILDTMLIQVTMDKLGIYLVNKGFHHATIDTSVKYRKKTALVTYQINTGPPCLVDNFVYHVTDTTMLRIMMEDTVNGKLRNGMIFDTYVLDDERDRIATNLRNNSYFNFSLSDIYYIADTSNAGLSANVDLYIKKIKMIIPGTTDSTAEVLHPRYFINNIFFTPDAGPSSPSTSYDTLAYKYRLKKSDTAVKTIYILYNKKSSLKPSFLASCLAFSQENPYSQSAINGTYKKLISQSIIGSANINMAVQNQGYQSYPDNQLIDCNIRITQNKIRTFTLGTEGTNSGGRFGLGVNTSIQNRNIFRGAEVLSFKLRTSAELQGSLNNQSEKYFFIFSTIDGGAEVSIDFPRILVPWRSRFQQGIRQGRTAASAGAGFEFRPEYKRTISTAAWTYKWNNNQVVRHFFTPLEINYIKIATSDSFQQYLETLTDPQYKSQYTDHLLTMIRYSIIFSNIGTSKDNNQYYLRLNAETSGNGLYFIDKVTGKSLSEGGYYERLGVRYSQYARFDFDFRKYWKYRFSNSLAFRFVGGIAYPYGNSASVPFEKSFWLGGANDMRGWRLRSLGPGGYSDANQLYDKTGDIILQSTLEHRFPIYSFINGSLFVDAGNVWLRQKSEDFPNGEFRLNTFYKQLAMDIGLGLRFDFSFFIFRLDGAVPIHNPALDDSWFNPADFTIQSAILNFGIGYPF